MSELALRRRMALPLDVIASVGVTVGFLGCAWLVGIGLSVFALFLALSVLAGIADPRAFAVLVLLVAPLPAVGDLAGAAVPLPLDPIDVLVVVGVGMAAVRARGVGLSGERLIAWVVAVNFALLVVAWFRAYGDRSIDIPTLALVAKPALVVLAAAVVVTLVPRESLARVLGIGFAVALAVVGASVLLQRAGLYSTAHQIENAQKLGAKQFGGLMLDGNSAGALIGVFAVPTFVLLRSLGSRVLPVLFLAAAAPVLLITLARGSLITFAVALAALAFVTRRRLEALRIAAAIALIAGGWALTFGQSQLSVLAAQYTATSADSNARLNGRLTIWNEARTYLDADPSRWLVGGGLGDFQEYLLTSPVGHAFATHNTFVGLTTRGGLLAVAAFLALLVAVWRLTSRHPGPISEALRLAALGAVVLGLSADVDLFSRTMTWFWVLLFAAIAAGAHGRRAVRSGDVPL